MTVSLPDELAEQVKRDAGGERRVSSYVAAALEDYAERENLRRILASWNAETPVPEEVRRQVQSELDNVGLTGRSMGDDRLAGVKAAIGLTLDAGALLALDRPGKGGV